MLSWVWVLLFLSCLVSYHPSLVLVRTLVSDLGASQPLTMLIDLGMVIFHPLLHLWRTLSLRSVFTLVVTFIGVVVYAWTLGLHLSFLFMSHRSPHCFLWVLLSWSFLPISYSLDSLLTILGYFGLIWLSCRVYFLYTLSEVSTCSFLCITYELAYRLGFHILLHFSWPYDCFILTLGANPFHGITEPSCCC